MKLLLKLKTLFIILLLFSCQPTGSSEYVIENTTDYSIRIEGFVRISHVEGDEPVYKDKIYAETILIPARSRYSTVRAHASGIDGGIFKRDQIDSVSIVFDGKRIIEQFCEKPLSYGFCDIERNIMDFHNSYFYQKRSKDENIYTYTFTEDDYERAILIN